MPQSVVEGSICQSSPFLYEQVEEPTDEIMTPSMMSLFIKLSIRQRFVTWKI